MNRIAAVLLSVALLVVGVAAPAVGAPPAADVVRAQNGTDGGGSPNGTVAPGARLSGVVDVQEAEVEGEIAGRAFGIAVARADTDAARAAIVAEQVTDLERRSAALRERKRALVAARENGSISEGRFRGEMAALAARTSALEGRLNRTATTADTIPRDLLAERGVATSAMEALRAAAGNLSGGEVAEIARSIAGPDVGRSLSDAERPVGGPPDPGLADAPGASNGTGGPDHSDAGGRDSPTMGDGEPANVTVDGGPAANDTSTAGAKGNDSGGGGSPVDVPRPAVWWGWLP